MESTKVSSRAGMFMAAIPLMLFFVPLINGLVGGVVGGSKAGNVKAALTTAMVPALIVALGLWILLVVLHVPIVGFIASNSPAAAIGLSVVGLFLGSAVGGALAHNRRRAYRRAG